MFLLPTDPPEITGFPIRHVYYRVCADTSRFRMWCNVTGVPPPQRRWYYWRHDPYLRKGANKQIIGVGALLQKIM